jgi:CopG-like RHH_1 or ribbon-helix-helix domain, RHH_5
MNRETPFGARIAFRLLQSLYDKLDVWAEEADRPLTNLIYTLVKQAMTERERSLELVYTEKEVH